MATNVNLLDRAPQAVIRGLNWALSPFEDLTGTLRPLWRDYSRYDLDVDMQVACENGAFGMANRCVMGWSGIDDTFSARYSAAGDVGMYRTSYGVLYPSLSVERFVDHWIKHHQEIDVIPRVLDAELQDGQSDAVIGEKIWHACELVKQYDGVNPIVYGRYLLLDRWLRYWTPEMIASVYFWGARYLWDRTREHPGPPYGEMQYTHIPADNWILHQTADKKQPYPGETSRSTIVDWDRWELGNPTQMEQWIANTWGGEIPSPDPNLDIRVSDLERQMADVEAWIVDHDHDHPLV